jgi:hypothetical protein
MHVVTYTNCCALELQKKALHQYSAAIPSSPLHYQLQISTNVVSLPVQYTNKEQTRPHLPLHYMEHSCTGSIMVFYRLSDF